MPAFPLTIYFSQTFKISVHCLPYIYINPLFTIGLQYQATWRALCLGLRIRHVSRGEGESFVPQNPFNLQGPCSLVLRLVASCFETRVSPLFEVRVPPVLIEARVASVVCPRLTCLRFSRPLLPPFMAFLLATQQSLRAPTQIYMYTYITPIPLKQQNTVTLTVIHYCLIVVLL